MKTIKFSTKEYIDCKGIISEDNLYVIITVDDVEFYKTWVSIIFWKNKTEEERLKYLFNYISSDLADELYSKKVMLSTGKKQYAAQDCAAYCIYLAKCS